MSFGLHSQSGPCSFCSNLQGRGWWLRSHLIINAGAVKLCYRSRPLGYCWSEALSKQNDSDGHLSHIFLCWGRPCWFWLAWRFQTLHFFEYTCSEEGQVSPAGNVLQHPFTWIVLQGFNQVLAAGLNQFTVHKANVTFHHKGVQSKYAEPQAGFTLELPLRFQWMQMPLPSLSSFINKRYFHLYRYLIPLGMTSPQADNYKPLNDSMI